MTSIKDRLRQNIAYMKEMLGSNPPFFFNEKGEFAMRASLSDVKSSTLRGYYMDYRRSVTHYHLWPPLTAPDENGVARADYTRWAGPEVGVQYFPMTIAQYALGSYELFLDTGNWTYKQTFLAQADWLMKNVRITIRDTAVWEMHYNFLSYLNLSIPWISAMAQGQIASALLRAYQLTGDMRYFSTAQKALETFRYSTLDGGVAWTDDEGFTFYEEFPTQPPCHVLNGHIWAMFGLYDYYRVTSSQDVLGLFNAGVSTLKRYLPSYDTGYWSRYDLLRKPGYAPIRYQHFHVELLKVLYEITHEEMFNEYAQRWSSCLKPIGKAYFALHLVGQRVREFLGNRLRLGEKT
ncbi:MAG: D-glucuronyl C5-epimerase [Dehalococcoidia bacterium]|nr:D-glucuronyl C5-epimerase [Dehalococcoidia bacterium]